MIKKYSPVIPTKVKIQKIAGHSERSEESSFDTMQGFFATLRMTSRLKTLDKKPPR